MFQRKTERKKDQQSNSILEMIYKPSKVCSFQHDYQITVYYYVSEKDKKKERKKERKKYQQSNGILDMILYVKCALST